MKVVLLKEGIGSLYVNTREIIISIIIIHYNKMWKDTHQHTILKIDINNIQVSIM